MRGRIQRASALAAAAALLLAAARPAAACSSFVVGCEPDGAVVTARTLDFSSDLTEYTSCVRCVCIVGPGGQNGRLLAAGG